MRKERRDEVCSGGTTYPLWNQTLQVIVNILDRDDGKDWVLGPESPAHIIGLQVRRQPGEWGGEGKYNE